MAGPDDPKDRARGGGLSGLAAGYQKAAPYMAASSSLVGAVLVFSLVGWWLDGKVGTKQPWFFIGGAVLGMIGGFISFFRTVLGLDKAKKAGPRA